MVSQLGSIKDFKCFICGEPSVTGMSTSKGFKCYACEKHRVKCYEKCLLNTGASVHEWVKEKVLEGEYD